MPLSLVSPRSGKKGSCGDVGSLRTHPQSNPHRFLARCSGGGDRSKLRCMVVLFWPCSCTSAAWRSQDPLAWELSMSLLCCH